MTRVAARVTTAWVPPYIGDLATMNLGKVAARIESRMTWGFWWHLFWARTAPDTRDGWASVTDAPMPTEM